ncbi:hypothetical protein FNI40_25205 [Salmonella enterica subsp. diarizonae]|nr:hypothetical protein [Salmonella enterica subsp. diarizonae]
MYGLIESSLNLRTVYVSKDGEKRRVVSVVASVVIWKTADPNLPAGAKSQGSATLQSFLRWKISEHEASEAELTAYDKVVRWREYEKEDTRKINTIKKKILKQCGENFN